MPWLAGTEGGKEAVCGGELGEVGFSMTEPKGANEERVSGSSVSCLEFMVILAGIVAACRLV